MDPLSAERIVQMKHNRYNTLLRVALLTLLVMVSTVFVGAVTYAGDPITPDATVTYRRNRITWDTPVDKEGIAQLNIFGDPAPGEEYPLIHPFSKDTFWLRVNNAVSGRVGYHLYLYLDDPTSIPVKASITRAKGMKDTDFVPTELTDKVILDSVVGAVGGKSMQNVEISWFWDSVSDVADTALGDRAVYRDLLYTLRVMVIVEDNNPYGNLGQSDPDWDPTAVLHRAYIFGYPDGTVRPESNITRAEVAAIFARLLAMHEETELEDTDSGFPDVLPGDWYAKYITAAAQAGLVNGYPDGNFYPNQPITRAEMAAICARYVEMFDVKTTKSDKSFPDVGLFHWARQEIRLAAQALVIEGYPDGTFKPDRYITRAEAVTMINRMLGRFGDQYFIRHNLNRMTQFTDLTDKDYWAYYPILEAANTHYTIAAWDSEIWKDLVEIEED